MNIFFFLGQTFFSQTKLMVRYIAAKHPDARFSAIVAARSNLMDELNKMNQPRFTRYDWLSKLEARWLDTPLDKVKLAHYRDIFGDDLLRRVIIADRELGYGYVSCGLVERTKLIDRTIDDDEARWRYVVGLFDYFFRIFEEEKPDIVFTYCVAGAVAYAMAAVAEHMNIRFIQPIYSRINDLHILDDNPLWLCRPVEQIFNASFKKAALLNPYIDQAREYLASFKSNPTKPKDTEAWISLITKQTELSGIAKTTAIDLARWGAIRLGLKGTRGVLRQRYGSEILKLNLRHALSLRKVARRKHTLFSYTLPTGDFIYYPLHVDPEASTMVLSPYMTDQVALIEKIAINMPLGMKLVVKEHVPCVGKRPSGFYERICRIPDVTLISPFQDSFELLKRATLVATITGTVGMEALMLGVPLITFGYAFYQIIGKGFIHYSEKDMTMKDAINAAMQIPAAPESEVHRFIAAIMAKGVRMHPSDVWFESVADLTKREESVKHMLEVMEV